MELHSDRLTYGLLRASDYADYSRWYMDAEVMKYITGHALTPQQCLSRFDKALETNVQNPGIGFYVVRMTEDDSFVGISKLAPLAKGQAEVGYGSLPQFWGMGFASEMLTTMVAKARTLPGVKEAVGIVHPLNAASIRVLTNQGFILKERGYEDKRPTAQYHLAF